MGRRNIGLQNIEGIYLQVKNDKNVEIKKPRSMLTKRRLTLKPAFLRRGSD
jgi:hypothetical protein